MLRGIILDIDGTLLDTLDDIHAAVSAVLEDMDAEVPDERRVMELIGHGVRSLTEGALPEGMRDPDTVAKTAERIASVYRGSGYPCTRPYPGVERLLSYLASIDVPMVVLSNRPHYTACNAMKLFFPDIPFRGVIGEREGQPIKPDPAAVRFAMDYLGTTDSETVMVGDTEADMQAAHAAGILAVGVSWGFRIPETLTDSGADMIVTSPMQIADLFRRDDDREDSGG